MLLIVQNAYNKGMNEGNVLLTHSTHHIHIVKDDSFKRGNPIPPHGLLFPISSKGSFISSRQDSTYHSLYYSSNGKEILTTHTTHFIYGYMASYHKDHSDSERGNPSATTWATLSD